MSELEFSVVMPVYHEAAAVVAQLDRTTGCLPANTELLVIYDAEDDPTVPYLRDYAASDSRVRPLLNTYGPGPAPALRFGLDRAAARIVVVTMADGSDDPSQIPILADAIRSGAAVAAGSRYVVGGRQEGGPFFKRTLSRLAGATLHRFAGVPIHDVTSAFKAYSTAFLRSVEIESTQGFEISLELVAKAHRLRLPMVEVPTVWRDRTEGGSHFRLLRWLPRYLHWWMFAFGPALEPADLQRRRSA